MTTRNTTMVVSVGFVLAVFATVAYGAWWPFSSDDDEAAATDATELSWEDLIPDDFVQPENPFITMSQEEVDKLLDGSAESEERLQKLQAEFNYAPVVDSLDGLRVKIPAYITPLEFKDNSLIKEFLLVPYVGACIHTPPPPANQVVFAESAKAVEYPGLYEPVWAVGVIRTETVKSDLAETGYRLEIEKMWPYGSEQ